MCAHRWITSNQHHQAHAVMHVIEDWSSQSSTWCWLYERPHLRCFLLVDLPTMSQSPCRWNGLLMSLGANCNGRGHGLCSTIAKRVATRIGIAAYRHKSDPLPAKCANVSKWNIVMSDKIILGQVPPQFTRVRRAAYSLCGSMLQDVQRFMPDLPHYFATEYTNVTFNGIKITASFPLGGALACGTCPPVELPMKCTCVSSFFFDGDFAGEHDIGHAVVAKIFSVNQQWFYLGIWLLESDGIYKVPYCPSSWAGDCLSMALVVVVEINISTGHCFPLEYIIHDVALFPCANRKYIITDLQGAVMCYLVLSLQYACSQMWRKVCSCLQPQLTQERQQRQKLSSSDELVIACTQKVAFFIALSLAGNNYAGRVREFTLIAQLYKCTASCDFWPNQIICLI